MSRLIDDMLTLSGTDSSHFTIQKTEVELDTLLLSVYEKFEPLAIEKGISLHISLPDARIPPCLCDQGRIEQVLSILLDNALSYTPSGGKIFLSLQSSSNQMILRVADTGIGISGSEKKAVFIDVINLTKTKPISDLGCALPRKSCICTRAGCGLRTHQEEAQPLSLFWDYKTMPNAWAKNSRKPSSKATSSWAFSLRS